ncbi:MAG: PKD domain-containing protein [Bacteroidota bacterium]
MDKRWWKQWASPCVLFFALWMIAITAAEAQVTADFTSNVQTGCSPLTVQFSEQATGPVTQYLWDFGNGNTSNLPNPGVIYVNPGTYTVSLTVSDGLGSNTVVRTQYITIFQDPIANFTASPVSGCAPLQVVFTDASQPGDAPIQTWLWDFGDGNLSSLPSPSHIYSSPGSYDITLVVTDTNGCSSSQIENDLVIVSAPLQAQASWTALTPCSLPYQVSFTASVTPTNTYSYLWDFGDGNTSTQTNPLHSYLNQGSYTVSLIATDPAGCADTVVYPNGLLVGLPQAAFTASDTAPCANQPISFLNQSLNASQYFWDFGDGTIFSGPNPTHTYASAGSYTVRLIASDPSNCADTLSRSTYIHVQAAPTALFGSSNPIGCQLPFVVNFTDLSQLTSQWSWDFGDGATASAPNPSHVYTAPGFYDITLAVTGTNGCVDTLLQPSYVQIVRPTADFVADTTSGCIPLSIDFMDLSQSPNDSIVSWIWDFGDGATSFLQHPSHTYTSVGQYSVQLVIVTQSGCRDTVNFSSIEAGIPPVVDFLANPLIVCAEDGVDFIDQSNVGTEWEWNFGDGGFSDYQFPTYFYGDTGTFDVTLIVTYFGCKDTLTRPDYVTVLGPIAEFFMTPTIGCEVPLTVQFTDASTDAQSWYWDFGDGTIDSSQHPTHVYQNLGSYTITLIVQNDSNNCSDTYTQTLDIFPPQAAFSATGTTGCTGLPVSFTNSSLHAVSYLWDFGDGAASTAANPTHMYTTPGQFDVTLVAINPSGCSDTLVLSSLVDIFGPDAQFVADSTTGCAPLNVSFTDASTVLPTSANILGWSWDFGDGNTSLAQHPNHTYTQAGSYDVRLVVVDDQGCSDTLIRTTYIEPTFPMAAFTSADTLACPGAPVSFQNLSTGVGNTYLWNFGDGNSSTVMNPVHIYPPNIGTYTVSLTATDVNGCVSSVTMQDFIGIGPPTSSFFAAPTQQACPPLTVNFTNQSSPNAVQWMWDFGDGSTSTLPNPSKVYGIPGQYTVSLIVSTAQGCTDTLVLADLIDLSGPTGSFSFTPMSGCSPLDVTFTANTTNAVNWTWDYGDGNLGFGQTSTHTYTQDTIAFPVLVIEDTAGCTMAIPADDSLVVQAGPIPGLILGQPQACVGSPLSFTDASFSTVPIIDYVWTFGDGDSAFVPSPQHTYQSAGTYMVQLTVTNLNGCTDSLSAPFPVTVGVPPTADYLASQLQGCAPMTVNFSDNTSSSIPLANWFWDFGDGNTSSQAFPAHTFANPGSYPVKMVVTTIDGCQDSMSQLITVHPEAVVAFIPSATDGCAPRSIQFTDQSSHSVPIQNWFWDFGDGGTSSQQHPIHTYVADGTFDVSLTITDVNGCVNTLLETDLIHLTRPNASFVSSLTQGCPPQQIAFTSQASSDTSILQWFWDFGDGNTANIEHPTHQYTDSGSYDVQLIVMDARGCRDTLLSPQLIDIYSPPLADFGVSDTVLCAPGNVQVSNLSTNGSSPILSYAYDFGNGQTATSPNATALYTTPGNYSIQLITQDLNGCEDTVEQFIQVHPGVIAAFTALDSLGCAGTNVTFLDQSSGTSPAVIWLWEFGDGNSSSQQFPTHTYSVNGAYSVSLTVENQFGCRDSISKSAFMQLSGPVADFSPDSISACPGSTIQFTDQSLGDTTLVAWLWDFGDGNTSTTASPAHTYSLPGIYDVSLTVTNILGCSHTTTKVAAVTITDPPLADFVLSAVNGCTPISIQMADASIPGSVPISSYSWDFGNGGSFNFPTANQTYVQAGNYLIEFIVTDGFGCSDTAQQFVQIHDGPQADFSSNLQQGCAPMPINFAAQISGNAPIANYWWEFGDGTTSSVPFPSHIYQADGGYDVSLLITDSNGCQDSVSKPQYINLGQLTVDFSISDTVACPGELVQITDITVPDTTLVSWSWDLGDGNTASGPGISHTYQAAGVYDIILVVMDTLGCMGTDTLAQAIEVWHPPFTAFALSDSNGCAPHPVQFADASSGVGVPITAWSWDFGNGTTASAPNPATTYPTPGSYLVQLTVTDAQGCSGTTSRQVEAFGPPSANFLSSTQLACVGESVQFQDVSTGNHTIASWLWDMGDGTILSQQHPTHTYSLPGTYSVSLLVVDAEGCIDSVLKPNWITIRAPQASFSLQPTTGCPGTMVSFSDQSQGDTTIVGWLWEFGDGGSSQLSSPTHTFQNAGFYDVTLIVTDAMGCSDSTTQLQAVEIYQPPTADIAAPNGGCWPFVLNASDSSSSSVSIAQWAWLLNGDIRGAGPQTQLYLDSVGTHQVGLIVTDANGCLDTSFHDVEVFPLPQVAFSVNDTVGCAPQISLFTDESSPIPVEWLWEFGDGESSRIQHPIHTYQQDGLYTVMLTIEDANGCVDSLEKRDWIELGRPQGDFTVDFQADCPPVEVHFAGVATSPYGIESYTWDFGDGQQGVGPMATHTYVDTGTYDITFWIRDSLGCELEIVKPNEVRIYGVDVPTPLSIHHVSVVHNEATRLAWAPDLSDDFAAYVVYREVPGSPGNWLPIHHTTARLDTIFIDQEPGFLNCLQESYCYKVVPQNLCGTEGRLNLAQTHCTIEVSSQALPDRVLLSWNPYLGWEEVDHYEIYRIDSYSPETAVWLDIVPASMTSYIDSATACFNSYAYRIRAIGPEKENWSWSDTTQIVNQKSQPTVSTELVRATVEEDRYVRVDWQPFGLRDLVSVFLEKSEDDGQSWSTVATVSPDVTSYRDSSVQVHENAYRYRLQARDSCGYSSPHSNVGTSILLQTSTENFSSYLSWTPYTEWSGGVDYYEIQLWVEAQNTFVQVDVVPGDQLTFVDGSTFLDQGEYCYRIVAHERGGNNAESVSNVACTPVQPELHVPNAFSPNGDNINDRYYLKGIYIRQFNLQIFNRWGKKLFEGHHLDDAWDGTYAGTPVPEGVYVVIVDAVGNNGKRFYEKGSITLIR